jgi:hypothetical protein
MGTYVLEAISIVGTCALWALAGYELGLQRGKGRGQEAVMPLPPPPPDDDGNGLPDTVPEEWEELDAARR